MNEWQPVGTAPPKNLYELLLLTNGISVVPGYYGECGHRWNYYSFCRGHILKYYPTHWMPLPNLPKQEKEIV